MRQPPDAGSLGRGERAVGALGCGATPGLLDAGGRGTGRDRASTESEPLPAAADHLLPRRRRG